MSRSHNNELINNSLLRREAGEGWHPAGLNHSILSAIVIREVLVDEIVETGGHGPNDQSYRLYLSQAQHVSDLKDKYGIDGPPLLEDV